MAEKPYIIAGYAPISAAYYARMGGPPFTSPSGEPANRNIDLRFTHQLAVMNYALEETGQQQTTLLASVSDCLSKLSLHA